MKVSEPSQRPSFSYSSSSSSSKPFFAQHDEPFQGHDFSKALPDLSLRDKRSAPDRIGLALVLQSFSDGGSEATLHGCQPERRTPNPEPRTPNPERRTLNLEPRTSHPLPNQPPELLLVHNPDIERARFLQLAAGLLACQQKIRFTADAGGQAAAVAPDQIRKYVSWLA
jgi:hypothetical protein